MDIPEKHSKVEYTFVFKKTVPADWSFDLKNAEKKSTSKARLSFLDNNVEHSFTLDNKSAYLVINNKAYDVW